MDYTRLGTSGLKVSRIALGCMSYGDAGLGWSPWVLGEEAAAPLFRQAVELGVTFWDTANGYSDEPIVTVVEQIAAERGVPMAQIALAWVLANPVVAAPIVGATKAHHLTDAVAALQIELTDDERGRLEEHYTLRLPTGY